MSLRIITKKFAFPLYHWYLLGWLALSCSAWLMIRIPQLSKQVINKIESGVVDHSLTQLTFLIITFGFLQIIARALSRILVFYPARCLETNLKNSVFHRSLSFPLTYFHGHPIGDIMSRLSNDIGQIRVFYGFAFLQAINFIFLLSFALSEMLAAHRVLTLLALLPLIFMIVLTSMGTPFMQKYAMKSQEALGYLSNQITEAFVHVPTIQTIGAEKGFLKKISGANDEVFKINLKLSLVRLLIFPLAMLLIGCSYLIILFYGGREIMQGRLTVGDLLSFNIYVSMLSFPLMALGFIISMYQNAKTAARRVTELTTQAIEPDDLIATIDEVRDPVLQVKNLNFTYSDPSGHGFALKDISFDLKRGERIGIMGPVGSGKSTLLNLIGGLMHVPTKQIFLGGHDIGTLNPTALRKMVNYALQSPFLFSDSIARNITFGQNKEQVSLAAVKEAAHCAHIAEDIEAFHSQWLTEVGEKGVRLSGGQKQRVALARLFVQPGPLWLLDDVTSALDYNTEAKIMENLMAKHCTMLIVSHRWETLKLCDKILVLDQGKMLDLADFATVRKKYSALISFSKQRHQTE